MQVNAINTAYSAPSFGKAIVTLSKENLGQKIKTDVVDTFNRNILPEIQETQYQDGIDIINAAGGPGRVIQNPNDFKDEVVFFALGAGKGTRFKELAETVGDYNKVSLPFKVDNGSDIHMLDFAMAMGKTFIDTDGVETIISDAPSGSFGDIVKYYLEGNPIKDTIVCCGDNVFGDSAADMMKFFTATINNPDKHVALVGVGRTPEEVAERFGVLDVEGSINDPALKLKGFKEKPKLDVAQQMTVNGQNVANTGLFYISKEAMEKLMDEIRNGENNIKKNDKEPYDFANAVKYVHSKTEDWFGVPSKDAADVMVVKKWEDVGEPDALYQFVNDVKKHGTYLLNFPKAYAQKVRDAFSSRVHLDGKTPYINFTDSNKVTKKQVNAAKDVEGVKIVV